MVRSPSTCRTCGASHPTGAGYVRRRGRTICALCATRLTNKGATREGLILWTLFALTAATWLTDTPPALRAALTAASLIWLVQAAIVVVHELGHALTAIALGVRVRSIDFGAHGPVILSIERGRFSLRLRLLPLAGFTGLEPPQRAIRLRHLIITVAGPLSTVALIWAAFTWETSGWVAELIRSDAVVLGVLSVIVNLVIPLPGKGNDASAVWKLLTMSDEELDSLAGVADHDETVRRLGAHISGESLADEQLDAIRQFLVSRLEHPGLIGPNRALEANNLAAVDLIAGRPDLLAEADEMSKFAYEELPIPEITSTRGSVLVALGRTSEGTELLERALPGLRPDHKDSTRANLALAALHADDLFSARNHVAAMRSEPNIPAFSEVQRLLGPAEVRNVVDHYWTPGRSADAAAAALASDAGPAATFIARLIADYVESASPHQLSDVVAAQFEATTEIMPDADWLMSLATSILRKT